MTVPDFKISAEHIEWLKHYLHNASPSGNEIDGQKIWLEYIRDFVDTYRVDAFGNVVAIINLEAKFKVLIESHADEIAWYVHRITNDGFLYVEKNGGSDPGIAPSQKVLIRTSSGRVPAIFGWPAIHNVQGQVPIPKKTQYFSTVDVRAQTKLPNLAFKWVTVLRMIRTLV